MTKKEPSRSESQTTEWEETAMKRTPEQIETEWQEVQARWGNNNKTRLN